MSHAIFPLIRVFAWDTAEIASPVGLRNLPGGSFAFKYMVASGCRTADPLNPSTTSGTLLFENTKLDLTSNTTPPNVASKPACITFNLATSGVDVFDMGLFLIDDTALKPGLWNGCGEGIVQYAPSGSLWKYNLAMPSGHYPRLTTTIPDTRNVLRQDGATGLIAEDDGNSSEFVYLNIVLPYGFPLGNYGVCGSGILRFGLVFNYSTDEYVLSF